MRSTLTIPLLALALAASSASAQQLQLPQPSPLARAMQRVGLNDITIEYSSPGVKGRPIWGALVPYDAPWRTGANASTKITFTRDVTIGGKAVKAGTYAVATIPGKAAWTVALSSDLTVFGPDHPYDAKNDVARIEVKPQGAPHRERMTFLFTDTTDDATSLDLEWEKLRVSIPIATDTKAHALANIDEAIKGAWRPHASAGRYYADTLKDNDTALKMFDKSIAIESTWFNNWLKADVLAKMGKFKEARKHAQVAWDLGDKAGPGFFFRDLVKKALEDWKGK